MITDRQEQMPVKKNTSPIKIGNVLQNINSQLINHKFNQQAVELIGSRQVLASHRKRINTDLSEKINNDVNDSQEQMRLDVGEGDDQQLQDIKKERLEQSREQQQIKHQQCCQDELYQPEQLQQYFPSPSHPQQPHTQHQVFPSNPQPNLPFNLNQNTNSPQIYQQSFTKVPSQFVIIQQKKFNNIAYTYNEMKESLVVSSRELVNEEVSEMGNIVTERKQKEVKEVSLMRQQLKASKEKQKSQQEGYNRWRRREGGMQVQRENGKQVDRENGMQVESEDKPIQTNIQSNQPIQLSQSEYLISPPAQNKSQQPNSISQTYPIPKTTSPDKTNSGIPSLPPQHNRLQPKTITQPKAVINQINSSQSISQPSEQLIPPQRQTKKSKIDETLPHISANKSPKQNSEPFHQSDNKKKQLSSIQPITIPLQSQPQPQQQPPPQHKQKSSKIDSSPQNNQQNQQLKQQSQSQQQPQPSFNLTTYQLVQPLLQQLLMQLKSYLKMVKNDQLLRVNSKTKEQKVSKFFYNMGNRKELNSEVKAKNKSLMDILERRNAVAKSVHEVHQGQSHGKSNSKHVAGSSNINKLNKVPLGLGSFGNDQQPYLKTQYPNNPNLNPQSGASSRLQSQAEEKQKLIKNREKINEILASSMANFKQNGQETRQKKSKSGAFFIRSNQRTRSINKAQHQPSQHNQPSQLTQGNGHSNPIIIRSTNLTKLTRQKAISTTQMPSNKTTIQPPPQPLTLTPLLKPIRQYLQLISTGQVDQIELFLQQASEANQEFLSPNNINELITRKRLFKTVMYFQRAVVVAGVGYGYLMVTGEKGMLRYQVQRGSRRKQKESEVEMLERSKEQTQLILKYMINLVSFALNNCKLITNTITTHFLPNTQTKPTAIHKQLLKRNLQTIKLNLQYINETFLKLFSQTLPLCQSLNINEDFGESFKNITKLIAKQSIQESFYTLLEYFAFYLALTQRQRAIPFLAVAPNPYLDETERYTLVVDFVSVFCQGSSYSKKLVFRPYAQHFLTEMSRYYQIVLYCNALPQEIDKVVDLLDGYRKIGSQGKQSKVMGNNMTEENIISHRLYKYHMVEEKLTGKMVKKLQRIGRDLQKVIMIDSQQNRLIGQDGNTIFVKQWRGSKNDATLAELCSVLISISVEGLNCRRAAERIDQQMRINLQNGIRHINFGLNLKEDLMQNQMDQGQGQQNLE